MYEAVHAHRDGAGAATLARHALTAAELGYEGLVVRNAPATAQLEAVAARYDVDIASGVEIRTTERSAAAAAISQHRPQQTLVIVRGHSVAMNRFAVEEPRVDVLAHPMRGSGDVNHVLAEAAARNGVRVEFDLGPVMQSRGRQRVQAIGRLQKLHDMITACDAPYVVTAGVESHLDWRSPRDLAGLAVPLDWSPAWIREGLAEWGRLVGRNRRRHAESFIQPGVRIDTHEKDD
jgi:ribonuclease P/MRP protein subunit RPP1